MNERQLIGLCRRFAHHHSPGLPPSFATTVMAQLRPFESLRDALPLLVIASALALSAALLISSSAQAPPPGQAPPALSIFGPLPEQAPFSAP